MVKSSVKVGLGVIGLCAVIGTGTLIKSIETVSEGSVAVVYSTNGVQKEPLGAGWHVIAPVEKTFEYPVRNQSLTDEAVSVTTFDGKAITLDISYQYKTDPKKVVGLYKNYGRQDLQEIEVVDKKDKDGDVSESHEAYKSVSLSQDIKKIANEVISKYTFTEIYQSKKAEVNAELLQVLAEKEAEKGFIIDTLTMNVTNLDQATQDTMNAKVAETATQERKKLELETAKLDAEQKRVVAEGEAEKARIEAQQRADGVIIEAEAQKQANELVKQSITPDLLQKQWIEKWNGVLPTVSGDATPIIQMPEAK